MHETPTRLPLRDISSNDRRVSRELSGRKTKERKQPQKQPNLPLATDPEITAAIWQQVSHAMSNRRAAGENTTRSTRQSSRRPRPPTPTGSAVRAVSVDRSSVTPSASVSQTQQRRPHRPPSSSAGTITIRDRKFDELVFFPRGIRVSHERHRTPYPRAHFRPMLSIPAVDRDRARSGPQNDEYSAFDSTRISVVKDAAREISREYRAMRQDNLNEEEYKAFALEVLLLNERRADKDSSLRAVRAERMLDLTHKPSEEVLWRIPPLAPLAQQGPSSLTESIMPSYSWDIRADCSYWLQLRGFSEAYRHQIQEVVYVRSANRVTCPYLTVEFKREEEEADQAVRQTLGAAAMALWNRWRLHADAVSVMAEATDQPNSTSAASSSEHDVRHYAMTICKDQCIVWTVEPTVHPDRSQEWTGCTMSRLAQLDCREEKQVEMLIEWVNCIHHWGLTKHAQACEADVKTVLGGYEVEVSGFG